MSADPVQLTPETSIRRFDRTDRVLHLLLMLSFLGLALTGLPLLFSDGAAARWVFSVLGDFRVAGLIHRGCAVLLMAVFATHLGRVIHRLIITRDSRMLWGPDSLIPQPRDAVQLLQHVRWFIGRGSRPRFDRFTYWEKFDYWAVFWGMGVIGLSGLMMWFPFVFSGFLPGWAFNVAMLIHGEEALLAVVFIFTVHFFNGHLRPEKFPMDTVIFVGRTPLHELQHERPAYYDRLARSGKLPEMVMPPAPRRREIAGRIVGTIAVLTGLVMVVLIARALLMH